MIEAMIERMSAYWTKKLSWCINTGPDIVRMIHAADQSKKLNVNETGPPIYECTSCFML